VVIILLLVIICCVAYCFCRKKVKQVEVDRGELQRNSTDEENPEIMESSKTLLNDSLKKKQNSDYRNSTGDLDLND